MLGVNVGNNIILVFFACVMCFNLMNGPIHSSQVTENLVFAVC